MQVLSLPITKKLRLHSTGVTVNIHPDFQIIIRFRNFSSKHSLTEDAKIVGRSFRISPVHEFFPSCHS